MEIWLRQIATVFMELICAVLDIAQTRKSEAAVCAWLTRPLGGGSDAGVGVELFRCRRPRRDEWFKRSRRRRFTRHRRRRRSCCDCRRRRRQANDVSTAPGKSRHRSGADGAGAVRRVISRRRRLPVRKRDCCPVGSRVNTACAPNWRHVQLRFRRICARRLRRQGCLIISTISWRWGRKQF